jgi:phenylacetate-CoA ligase
MLHKGLFILAHQCYDTSFYPTYKKLVKNQWKPYSELKHDQEKKLMQMIGLAYENVPYYHNLFKGLGIRPGDIRTVEDLEKLPILTKDIIKNNWEDFKPANLSSMKYYNRATGGSTGTPMQYRLSKHDRFLGGALLYRGWGYGGYGLGDKMVSLAGSSLDIGTKSNLATKVHEIVRYLKKLSSFDMGEIEMRHYAEVLNTFHPKFIRGYASSIYFFAQWLDENDISVLSPDAVFTTAEVLLPNYRDVIEKQFNCKVFDQYGSYDGGGQALECNIHKGLHITAEKCILEIVDEAGNPLSPGQSGRIIVTDLYNYAMPFIRYEVGDIGTIDDKL